MQGTPLSSHSCELMSGTLLWEKDVIFPKHTCSPHTCLGTRAGQEQVGCSRKIPPFLGTEEFCFPPPWRSRAVRDPRLPARMGKAGAFSVALWVLLVGIVQAGPDAEL